MGTTELTFLRFLRDDVPDVVWTVVAEDTNKPLSALLPGLIEANAIFTVR